MYELNPEALFDEDRSGWPARWPAQRRGTKKLVACETQKNALGVTLTLRWEAPGVHDLEQRITLCSDRPAVEFRASFQKDDVITPESIYFVFPLQLSRWKAFFDPSGLPAEFDAEQLPGSCRDWLTVGQWVAVADKRHGVTLACPDAPLVQVGSFNFGKEQMMVARKKNPLLLAWATNNYWHTNFRASQPGYIKMRYELETHGPYDPLRSIHAGLDAITPVELHPVMKLPEVVTCSLLDVTPRDIVPMHCKPAEDGDGVIVLLLNSSSKALIARARLPQERITGAHLVNTLEENQKQLEVDGAGWASVKLAPRSIVSIRLRLS